MLGALRRLGKKFIIFLVILILLPILLIIFLAIIQGCGNSKISPEKYEQKMVAAFKEYLSDKNNVPVLEGDRVTIELSTLVKEGYIKSPEKLLREKNCTGSVSVVRNGSSIEQNNGGYLNYTHSLVCDDYKANTLINKIKENIVTEGSGLYANTDEYIFRGEKVNNYINFYGHDYRIVSMDKNGILKLVKSESELSNKMWDNKFNVETNRNSGKNIYKDSAILEYLLIDYNNNKKIKEDARKYIVAKDICVGKRSNDNYSIDSSIDCSEKLEKQVISLLNVSDYAKASLDPDCINLNSRSCNNYNYLSDVASSTWTLNVSSDTTYEVMYLSNGLMMAKNANSYNQYNIVIYIDGNIYFNGGTGSETSPFVIE